MRRSEINDSSRIYSLASLIDSSPKYKVIQLNGAATHITIHDEHYRCVVRFTPFLDSIVIETEYSAEELSEFIESLSNPLYLKIKEILTELFIQNKETLLTETPALTITPQMELFIRDHRNWKKDPHILSAI